MSEHELSTILQELDQARDLHREAVAQTNQAVKIYVDLGHGHPDGTQALARANGARRAAFERYRRALDVFNEHCRESVKRSSSALGSQNR